MVDRELDLDDISGKVCLLKFKFEYKFEDQSATTFQEALQALPFVNQDSMKPTINFGSSLENIGLNQQFLITKSCQNRVISYQDKVR